MNPTAVYRGKPEITSNRRQGRIATIRLHGYTQGRTTSYPSHRPRTPEPKAYPHPSNTQEQRNLHFHPESNYYFCKAPTSPTVDH